MILWQISAIVLCFPLYVHLYELLKVTKKFQASTQKVNSIKNNTDKIVDSILTSFPNKQNDFLNIQKNLHKVAQFLGTRGQKHIEAIMQGIKLKAYNTLKNTENTEFYDNDEEDHLVNRKIIDDLSNKINVLIKNELDKLPTSKNKKILLEKIKDNVLESFNDKQKSISKNNYVQMGSYKNTVDTNDIYELKNSKRSSTVLPLCEDVPDRICSHIKDTNTLKCIYDADTVSLDKLCDNNNDCPDGSDEKYCGTQAMEKMQHFKWVINNIEIALQNHCLESNEDSEIWSMKEKIIRDVVGAQEDFNNVYKKFNSRSNIYDFIDKKETENVENHKDISNEIALIISSFALALDGAICSQGPEDIESRKFIGILDDTLVESPWPPQNCKCQRQYCFNCTNVCKRICWQKHSLISWNCESINSTDTVSLNSLCDGKLDCYDESDEKDCILDNDYDKFKARELYSNLMEILSLKASKEPMSVRKQLISLQLLISKLQKVATQPIAYAPSIKKLRTQCYSTLSIIYSEMLKKSIDADELEQAYLFLLSISNNLGGAMKLSHTGNTRVIGAGCYCRKGSCAKAFCSKVCTKACAVEPKITRYPCGSNITVSLNDVCNGKQNCPNGDDEKNCKTDEICRRHHLKVLRNSLQDVGNNLKGTSLGELLIAWKSKVVLTIKVVEKNGKPTPKVIKSVIKDILTDLLTTYGSVQDYRRTNNGYALAEFMNIAHSVMKNLKTCGL